VIRCNSAVDAEIRPQPSEEEREVLAAALALLGDDGRSPYDSAWRRAALDDEEQVRESHPWGEFRRPS
jgi:hypothetical protein